MSYTLVVLESAAKCGKVEGYLGQGYKCLASFGHIRELRGLESITYNPDGSMDLKYSVSTGKSKRLSALRAAAKKASEVVLATDDDREGEAIAWHVREALGLGPATKRIIFNEITRPAIRQAIQNPRRVDMDRVAAQQAREVIDLTVGYKVSPVLWSKISRRTKKGLSAGRCQTPALRLVADNDQEAKEAATRAVYTISGTFTKLNLVFKLDRELDDAETAEAFMAELAGHDAYEFSKGVVRKYSEKPPPPFTTSLLQQTASSQLGFGPKRTMSLAQKLYEAGHITYMRTDSQRLAPEFVTAAKGLVRLAYGENYVAGGQAAAKVEAAPGAQDAHEAVRPTLVGKRELEEGSDPAERRLYQLIWRRSVAYCMTDAVERRFRAAVSAPKDRCFTCTVASTVFHGWKVLYDRESSDEAFNLLRQVKGGSQLPPRTVEARVGIRGKKARYTQASLISKLEALGIGRPSTFASIVSKIEERGYVRVGDVPGTKKQCTEYRWEAGWSVPEASVAERVLGGEKKKLVLQPLGRSVVELLESQFGSLFEYEYTANMEADLDRIAKGEKDRDATCVACAQAVSSLVVEAGGTEKGGIRIDDAHQYIIGKHGPVIKCTDGEGVVTFKGVKTDIDLDKLRAGEYSLADLLVAKVAARKLGTHEGKEVTLRVGRYGPYLEWNGARRTVPASAGAPDELTLDSVLPLITRSGGNGIIRIIDRHTSIRSGPHGDYVFHKKPGWKRPVFTPVAGFIRMHGPNSYKDCDLSLVTAWLESEHGITCTEEASEPCTSGGSRRGAGRTRGSGRRGRRGN